jgi:cation diffusion facilitator family transporter
VNSSAGIDGRARAIKRVLWQILVLNVVVAAAKAGWGLLSNSSAMFADGIHSLTDGASNVVALIAMTAASKPLDESHPYGHHKYESFASAVIAVLLLLAAWRVASQAIGSLVAYLREGLLPAVEVTSISFTVMLVTLAINVYVVACESHRGRQLGSDLLQSDARHTLSDIWVTLGVIASLVLVKLGLPLADPLVGLLVAVFIVVAAFAVLKGVDVTFSDHARLDARDVHAKVVSFPGVKGCHNIRTRGTGAIIHMDMSILVDPAISVAEGHAIANGLETWLCGEYAGLKDVVVHVEPDTEEQRARPFLSAKYK